MRDDRLKFTFRRALNYLYNTTNYEKMANVNYTRSNFNLSKMRKACKLLGNPQDKFQSIHITGTKGKGSVGIFCASILKEAGLKVGLYQSPHLLTINERIKINFKNISDKAFAECINQVKQIIDKHKIKLTFFEIMTIVAFLFFAKKNIDIAIIEVGLGGRLDATNVIKPIYSVITNIGKDHTLQLGKTLKKIALEKGGIIKRGRGLICGETRPALRALFEKICRAKSAPIFLVDKDFKFKIKKTPSNIEGGYSLDFISDKIQVKDIRLNGISKVQVLNASIAIYAVIKYLEYTKRKLKEDWICLGIKNTILPGRIQLVHHNPLVILDSAHNSPSINALINALRSVALPKKTVIMIGIAQDKDLKTIIKPLTSLSNTFICTVTNNPRASTPELLKEIIHSFNKKAKVFCEPEISKGYNLGFKLAGKRGLLVVAGSFYLTGDVIKLTKIPFS